MEIHFIKSTPWNDLHFSRPYIQILSSWAHTEWNCIKGITKKSKKSNRNVQNTYTVVKNIILNKAAWWGGS